jgi:hypothetical protein
MWFGDPVAADANAEPITINGTMKVALVVAAVLVVLIGVLPNELLEAAERSAATLSIDAPALGLGR